MLIFSIFLYLITGAAASLRFFKELTLNKLVVTTFLTAILLNTLVAELLSLFHTLNNPALFLMLQVVFCGILIVFLVDPGRRIFTDKIGTVKFRLAKLRGADWILTALIAAVLAGCLYIGTLAPINNSDSLHTHLPRIYYWLQHCSMGNWAAVTNTQLTYPIIIPIQGLWLFLLGGSENLFFLVQWFALLASVILVYEISLLLGASIRQGLVAGLASLSFPVVLLQTFSLQGDVFVTAVLLTCVYLVLAYYKTGKNLFLYLSILPMALSLGAKQTAFLFLPIYLAATFLLLRKRIHAGKTALRLLFLFLASFAIFSSFKFIQNALHKDDMEESMFATYRYTIPFTQGTSFRGYATNILRYAYQWISLDGLNGQLKLVTLNLKNNTFKSLTHMVNLDLETHQYLNPGDEDYFEYNNPPILNEDAAWFGIISWTLIPVGLIVGLIRKERVIRYYALASLVLSLVCFLATAILISGWGPTNGRYMVIPTILMTPLISFIIPRNKIAGSISIIVVGFAAIYLAFSTLLINESRPVITESTLYKFQVQKIETIKVTNLLNSQYRAMLNRVVNDLLLTSPDRLSIVQGSYYDKLFFQNSRDIENIRLVNDNLPAGEPLYLRMNKSLLEYALFGVNRTRELYPVKNLNEVPSGAYMLFSNALLDENIPELMPAASNGDYSLLMRK